MIGVFDSGLGGLTVLRALVERYLKTVDFVYSCRSRARSPTAISLPKTSSGIRALCVEELFSRGAKLTLLGCNTATAVALRRLQQDWLPQSRWVAGHNVLGIVAPDGRGRDADAVGGDVAAISAEIQYRHDRRLRDDADDHVGRLSGGDPQALSEGDGGAADLLRALRGRSRISSRKPNSTRLFATGVEAMLANNGEMPPHRRHSRVCTHFPLVEHLFRKYLPPFTRILSQPEVVADSFEDYLARRSNYLNGDERGKLTLLTTGDPDDVSEKARVFLAGRTGVCQGLTRGLQRSRIIARFLPLIRWRMRTPRC